MDDPIDIKLSIIASKYFLNTASMMTMSHLGDRTMLYAFEVPCSTATFGEAALTTAACLIGSKLAFAALHDGCPRYDPLFCGLPVVIDVVPGGYDVVCGRMHISRERAQELFPFLTETECFVQGVARVGGS